MTKTLFSNFNRPKAQIQCRLHPFPKGKTLFPIPTKSLPVTKQTFLIKSSSAFFCLFQSRHIYCFIFCNLVRKKEMNVSVTLIGCWVDKVHCQVLQQCAAWLTSIMKAQVNTRYRALLLWCTFRKKKPTVGVVESSFYCHWPTNHVNMN